MVMEVGTRWPRPVADSAGAGQTSVCPAGWIASGRVSRKMSAGLARVKLFGEFRKAEQPQPHQPNRKDACPHKYTRGYTSGERAIVLVLLFHYDFSDNFLKKKTN